MSRMARWGFLTQSGRRFEESTLLSSSGDLLDVLLIPFYVHGERIGTIWVTAYDESRRFDLEDLRMMTSLATFTGAAYQTWLSANRAQQLFRS